MGDVAVKPAVDPMVEGNEMMQASSDAMSNDDVTKFKADVNDEQQKNIQHAEGTFSVDKDCVVEASKTAASEDACERVQSFDALGLSEDIVKKLKDLRYVVPTETQELIAKLVPLSEDVAVFAPHEQGKSSAGVLATVRTIDFDMDKVQVLYVVYTNGMINRAFNLMQAMSPTATLKAYRAMLPMPLSQDMRTLFRTVNHAVIGVAGRMCDLVHQRATDFSAVKMVVIDQADLVFERRRGTELVLEMLQGLPAAAKILLLARGEPQISHNLNEFLNERMGGRQKAHIIRSPSLSPEGEKKAVTSRANRASSAGVFPSHSLKWAVLTTETENALSESAIRTFFDGYAKLLNGKRMIRSTLRLEPSATFVERVSDLSSLQNVVTNAKDQGVALIFYVSPLNLPNILKKAELTDLGEAAGVVLHAVRHDLVVAQQTAPIARGYINGSLRALATSFRRVTARKEGKEIVPRARAGSNRRRQITITSMEVCDSKCWTTKAKQPIEDSVAYYVDGPKNLECHLFAATAGAEAEPAKVQVVAETDGVFRVVISGGQLVFRVAVDEPKVSNDEETAKA